MLDLQRHIGLLAVGAAPLPLFEQVLTQFIARQGPLLILDATYLWVLQRLSIKPHQFLRHRPNGAKPTQACDPREDVGNPALQGRRQPAWFAASILPPCLTVARLALAAFASHGMAVCQVLSDPLAPMGQFCRPDHFPAPIV